MPNFLQFVATLREQMQAELSRSDVLRVLVWPVLLLLIALLSAVGAGAPDWLIIGLAIFAALTLLLYLGSFVFLLFTDRDALRSEKYSLHKMAIEHGLYGDDKIGLRDDAQVISTTATKALPAQKTGPTGEVGG